MNTDAQLAKGIEAAKRGDRVAARHILYAVLDAQPRNETAWLWLSYVVESVEDRQICLENILLLNPHNAYARQGLAELKQLARQTKAAVVAKKQTVTTAATLSKTAPAPPISLSLVLTIAFWSGLGVLLLSIGGVELAVWGLDLLLSRNFPSYITPFQLFALVGIVGFLILGILATNVAWALFRRHKLGYFVSLLASLGLILLGPSIVLLSQTPSYILAAFMAVMPTVVLFLTLMSQTGFEHD